MQFDVVKNIRDPWDKARKEGRYAVVIDTGNELVVLPCTTYFQRTGTVPVGAALLTRNNSPVWAKSGFSATEVCISFRDAFIVLRGSSALDYAVQVGILDLGMDKRFNEVIRTLTLQYLGHITKKA